MGWIYRRTTREDLICGLIAPEINERAIAETLAYEDHGDILWSVMHITARQDGICGLRAGAGVNFIVCHLIGQKGNEWGYLPIQENMGPRYYDCPLHFLEMAPVGNDAWREQVRARHAEQAGRNHQAA
jgi:hypothetical protein